MDYVNVGINLSVITVFGIMLYYNEKIINSERKYNNIFQKDLVNHMLCHNEKIINSEKDLVDHILKSQQTLIDIVLKSQTTLVNSVIASHQTTTPLTISQEDDQFDKVPFHLVE